MNTLPSWPCSWRGTAFANHDLRLLLDHEPIKTIVAVGADGTWYLLTKEQRGGLASTGTALAALRTALESLSPDYARLAAAGHATREQALRRLPHAVWQFIAPPLGLRYERVGRESEDRP